MLLALHGFDGLIDLLLDGLVDDHFNLLKLPAFLLLEHLVVVLDALKIHLGALQFYLA